MKTELYINQRPLWPKTGRHILCQFADEEIIVYQAYSPAIGGFAVQHQYFGGDFKLSRMSWIKTNFLWMMYRSGWGSKQDQEVTLAITLRCETFESILKQAVHSTFVPEVYPTQEDWKRCLSESPVRIQWDPDHDPSGNKQERRAIQLGLSGGVLKNYTRDWIVKIEDISAFVAEQWQNVSREKLSQLYIPNETVYPVKDESVCNRLGIAKL